MCSFEIAGCNLHCLDKNYGGVLIIWDRLFGTFQEKEQRSEIIYGLVVNVESFNPIYLQVKKFLAVNFNFYT